MADTKISALAAVTDLQDTDEFVLARAGTTKKIDGVDLKAGVNAFHGVRVSEAADQSITSATVTAITFGTEAYDTDAYHSTVSNTSRLTVPTGLGGYYSIKGFARWDAITTGTYRRWWIRANGVTSYDLGLVEPEATGWSGMVVGIDLLLAATDYVELCVDHDRGSALNIKSSSAPAYFMMHLIGV
jgi:hypothetical protein